MAINLPVTPDPNARVLAGFRWESFTGLTGTTVSPSQVPQGETMQVWKNGARLTQGGATNGWSVSDGTVTLTEALIAGDVVDVSYWPRTGGG